MNYKQRYPDLAFLLSFFPYEKKELPKEAKGLMTVNLDEIEVLYIVGLIDYPLPANVKNWLLAKQEHALVFIEEDLGAFAGFSDQSLIDHPQVHLVYAQEDPIESLAQTFPTDRLAIYQHKPFDGLRLEKRSAAMAALYSDVLYSHKIADNVLTNYGRLGECFEARGEFTNLPAIICGAGPSLEKVFGALQQSQDKALIFAGGSAITSLSRHGIRPHFAMALDPNEEEWHRLKQAFYFEGPFLFAPRLHEKVFATANGPFGFLKTDTGGQVENWLEEKMGFDWPPIGPDLGSEAFSVTTLAVAYAVSLGCNPIIFAGVDLCSYEGKRYAKGIEAEETRADPRALEKPLERQDIYGHPVKTLLKWEMEAQCLSAYAKKHPHIRFLNATEGGLGFEGIKNTSIEKALNSAKSFDLSGRIHQWIQGRPLEFEASKFKGLIEELASSLERCQGWCQALLKECEKDKETGKYILLESDFHDEPAYHCFLSGIDQALDHLLVRYFPHPEAEVAKRLRLTAKYNELTLQVEKFQKSIKDTCISVF